MCGADAVCTVWCGSHQPVFRAERTRCAPGGTVTIFKEHTLSRPPQGGRGILPRLCPSYRFGHRPQRGLSPGTPAAAPLLGGRQHLDGGGDTGP